MGYASRNNKNISLIKAKEKNIPEVTKVVKVHTVPKGQDPYDTMFGVMLKGLRPITADEKRELEIQEYQNSKRIVDVPSIPRPTTGPYKDMCWKMGTKGMAALEHCNLPIGHEGPHAWEKDNYD